MHARTYARTPSSDFLVLASCSPARALVIGKKALALEGVDGVCSPSPVDAAH